MALSNRTWRDKYRSNVLTTTLRNALVAEKICTVDRSNNKTIQSPYLSATSVTVQALAGTYTPGTVTTTDDVLTVSDEFISSAHIFDFESSLSNFDLFASHAEQTAYDLAAKIDSYAINNLCEDGTGAYTTPVGGFTTAANVNTIFANLVSSVSGYAESTYGNMFVVLENTDIVGLMAAGATNGFNFSDNVLQNGKVAQWMGVDIYVVRTGTFTDATMGTKTWTNAGHRVFGVKGVATLALPESYKYEEKGVSGKTGMEIVAIAYAGFKLWSPKTSLIVDVTLA